MSSRASAYPSASATPAPSSPRVSESYLSDLDGTASVIDGGDFDWDSTKVDPTTLNLVSWKLDVNARAGDGVDKRGFNAISTVLNHPTKKANPLRGSRKPLPPIIAPPAVPRPPPSSYYDSYLNTITPLYETFISTQASSSSRLTGDSQAQTTTRPPVDLPSLDSVPQLFFDNDFNLANPSTWSEIVDAQPEAGPPRLRTPESLSLNLDTLERHLLHEITLRSSAFFSALSNLQDLHSESSSCLTRIEDLQSSLREVKASQAQKGLEVIDAYEELRILRVAEQGTRKIGEAEEGLRIAKGLVEAGDWAGGLGCLADIVHWWERHALHDSGEELEEPERSISLPLSTIPALSHLPAELVSLTASIAAQLEAALSSLLLSMLGRADTGATLDEIGFRSSVEPMLVGLVQCGKTNGIEDVWREVTTTSIREGSRKHLPVSQTEDEGVVDGSQPEARGNNLAQSLKAMDHSQFLLLSAEMYTTLLGRLHSIQIVGEQLAETLARVSSHPALVISTFVPDPPSSATKTSSPTLDLNDVLTSACELANNRTSKVLAVRSEQHAQLRLEEFVEIFKESWDFVLATETLARRMIVSLRGVTASQARAFLVTYHAARLTQSAKLVEEEIWTQVDVAPDAQHSIDLLIVSAVSDPPECRIPPLPSTTTNGDKHSNSGGALAKFLSVEDKTFFVVRATTESMTLLSQYLGIVINLELVVTDVMARIIEFLKSFNSRTCQVVLGAGAMRSAGLKNITAKHLALASQSLSVVVALIPYIREFIRRHLSQKQAVMLTEFDKLKRDYQEHQNEIHAKLVAIMSDRLAVHCASLRDIDWESSSSKDGAREYAELLVKETTTLHKVLSKYLAVPTVEGVMSEVLAAIVHRLGEEYTKVELKSEEAKKRMTQDVTLISTRLSPLSEAGKAVVSLETLVKDKSTPRRPMGETMKGLLRRNATGSTSTKGKEREVEEAAIEKVNLNADESEGDVEDEDGPGIIDNAEVKETEGENGHSEPPATPPSDHPLATSDKDPVLPPEVESQTLANDDPILPPKLPDKDDTPVLPLPIDKDEPPTLPDKPDLNEIPPPSHGDRAAEEELDIEETPSEAEKSAIPGIP